MDKKQLSQMEQVLWECKSLHARSTRDQIIHNLPENFPSIFRDTTNDRQDAINILLACLKQPYGAEQFLDQIKAYEGESKPVKQLEKIINQVHSVMSTVFKNLIILALLWFILYIFAVLTDQIYPEGVEVALMLSPVLGLLGWIAWTFFSSLYRAFVRAVDKT
jgi:hypothetical protein